MLLTDEEINARLDEFGNIRVALDKDPESQGLQRVNEKLAEIQLHKDRVSYLLTEAIRNHAEASVLKEQADANYKRAFDLLIATDADVKGQKSEAQRSALARTKMPEEVLSMGRAEIDYIKANSYLKGLQSMWENLESANSNLSRQITVLQLSASMGEISRRNDDFNNNKPKIVFGKKTEEEE